MKKSIRIILMFIAVIIFVCSMFAGCNTSATLKDGTYKAEFSKADEHGWTEYVEITISDKKITNVVFDGIKDGVKKSEDKGYEEAMKNAGYKTWPSDFYSKLTTNLVETQNIDKVDAIAGATVSSNSFKKLVKSLTKNMNKGKTDTVKVEP